MLEKKDFPALKTSVLTTQVLHVASNSVTKTLEKIK